MQNHLHDSGEAFVLNFNMIWTGYFSQRSMSVGNIIVLMWTSVLCTFGILVFFLFQIVIGPVEILLGFSGASRVKHLLMIISPQRPNTYLFQKVEILAPLQVSQGSQ